MAFDYDYLIVGSGFGGSVSALRLTEKGYRVAVLEQGRRLGPDDFPKSNWDLRRWLWQPRLGWRGLFRMTFLRHVTVLSGVGVGGGSLVYANTLPVPKDHFFEAPSWGHLASWKEELEPHYRTARAMLGATRNPNVTWADEVVREVGRDLGREHAFGPSDVGIYFGEAGKTASDPYFSGEGPERTGCIQCGACMIGCRHNAKNSLDRNYLHLAEARGLTIEADTEVTGVRPLEGGGYQVTALQGARIFGRRKRLYTAEKVIFSGGVMGTVKLLLELRARANGLPRLSPRLGDYVRTNSEVLVGVVSNQKDRDFSKGIAIGSILHTDDRSHLEPVRYSAGSGFFRILAMPHAPGSNVVTRLARALGTLVRHPLKVLRTQTVLDWARSTMILLYMRTAEGHLRLTRGPLGMTTSLGAGPAPESSLPEATDLAHRVADKIGGFPQSIATEVLLGTPTTAHILGGCCMGDSPENGVIDHRHQVFGYEGLYVIDGSAISANPGVNPSLTITALAERAMSFIPQKEGNTVQPVKLSRALPLLTFGG